MQALLLARLAGAGPAPCWSRPPFTPLRRQWRDETRLASGAPQLAAELTGATLGRGESRKRGRSRSRSGGAGAGLRPCLSLTTRVFGKPRHAPRRAGAGRRKWRASGRSSTPATACAAGRPYWAPLQLDTVTTRVHSRPSATPKLTSYVATGEPCNCAGGFCRWKGAVGPTCGSRLRLLSAT